MDMILFLGMAAAIVAMLALASFFANCFYDIACEKGFVERRYFWVPFLFGIVGYLMVIALPDRGKAKPEQGASAKNTPVAKPLYSPVQVQKSVGKWACPQCGNVLPGDVVQCKCGYRK